MTEKEIKMIEGVLHRTHFVNQMDKNKVRRLAKYHCLHLVVSDFMGSIKIFTPNFDEKEFIHSIFNES